MQMEVYNFLLIIQLHSKINPECFTIKPHNVLKQRHILWYFLCFLLWTDVHYCSFWNVFMINSKLAYWKPRFGIDQNKKKNIKNYVFSALRVNKYVSPFSQRRFQKNSTGLKQIRRAAIKKVRTPTLPHRQSRNGPNVEGYLYFRQSRNGETSMGTSPSASATDTQNIAVVLLSAVFICAMNK